VAFGLEGYGCRGGGGLLAGLVAMEMGRIDASISTFFGVHSGLGNVFHLLRWIGKEQKQKWLPPMARMEKIGLFRSDRAAGGFREQEAACWTTAKRGGRHLDYQRPEKMDR